MFLDDIPIKSKLIGGFIVVILLALVIALIGFISMGDMADKANRMYDENLVSLDQLLNADNSFLNIRINIYKTVFAKDERIDKFAEIDDEISNIKSKIDLYRLNASTTEEKDLLKKFDDNWAVFEASLRTVIGDMQAGREEAALKGIYADEFSIPRDTAQDALDTLEMYNQERARLLKEEITATYYNSSLVFFFISGGMFIFGLGFAFVLTRSITVPLLRTMQMIKEMEHGHLGMRLSMKRKDEIGEMAGIMDTFADNLQNQVVRIMKEISEGMDTGDIPVMDDRDEIGPALKATAGAISRLINEAEKLTNAAMIGNLSIRGDESGFKGGYQKIISGFNRTLENLLEPLQEGMNLAGKFAGGNFSARFSDSVTINGDFIPYRDAMNTIGIESGKAVSEVQTEVETLLGGMEETSASVEEITAGAKTLAHISNEVSNLSEKSSAGILHILQAMQELSSAVQQVATETESVADLTRHTHELSFKGSGLVENTENGMQKIKTSFEETNIVVDEINRQMEEIGSIVEVISGIADQTNLLALNAAIEAARAGDAGLGFAVVADEVKDLAEESRHSAEKIATLIHELQQKSENVTISMNRSIKDVHTGDEAVRDTRQIFAEIADAIDTLSNLVTGVAATTQEQSSAVEQISSNVDELSVLVENTAKEAVSASAATEEASAALDQIAEVINTATSSINRISSSMGQFQT